MSLLVFNIFMSIAYFGCQNTTVEKNNFFYKEKNIQGVGTCSDTKTISGAVRFQSRTLSPLF